MKPYSNAQEIHRDSGRGKLSGTRQLDGNGPRLLYARKDAARLLSISQRGFDYLVAGGKIRVRRIGGRVLVTHKELARFVDALPETSEQQAA